MFFFFFFVLTSLVCKSHLTKYAHLCKEWSNCSIAADSSDANHADHMQLFKHKCPDWSDCTQTGDNQHKDMFEHPVRLSC